LILLLLFLGLTKHVRLCLWLCLAIGLEVCSDFSLATLLSMIDKSLRERILILQKNGLGLIRRKC